jgi:hypothetical protein
VNAIITTESTLTNRLLASTLMPSFPAGEVEHLGNGDIIDEPEQ